MQLTETNKTVLPGELTEVQKRTLSWTWAVKYLRKHSYEGTVPADVIAQRRKRGKAAKAARKVNRGN